MRSHSGKAGDGWSHAPQSVLSTEPKTSSTQLSQGPLSYFLRLSRAKPPLGTKLHVAGNSSAALTGEQAGLGAPQLRLGSSSLGST